MNVALEPAGQPSYCASFFSRMDPMKRFLLSCLVAAGLCLPLSGCFSARLIIPSVQPAERHRHWVNGFLWGLVGGETSAEMSCGQRLVAAMETKRSVGNYLVSWLTLGIYSPSTVIVTCGQGYQNYYQGSAAAGPVRAPAMAMQAPIYIQPPPQAPMYPPAYVTAAAPPQLPAVAPSPQPPVSSPLPSVRQP